MIDPPYAVRLPVQDVGQAADPVAQAHRLADEEARTPFDLARGPLLRARLMRLADTDHVLLTTLHHIAGDGWSMGVFQAELSVLYGAFAARQPSPLPPLEIQYADFAEWQRSYMSGEVLAEQLDYWREALLGMPAALELPADRARPPMPSYTAGAVPFEIPPDVAHRLRAVGAQRHATLFMVLLAAFDATLAGYTGGTDIVVGVAGRGPGPEPNSKDSSASSSTTWSRGWTARATRRSASWWTGCVSGHSTPWTTRTCRSSGW